MKNGFQRLDGGLRIAGNINDQAGAQGRGDGAAHGGKWGIFQSLTAHVFSESFQDAFAHRPGSLRRDIAGGDPGASGCDHQPCMLGLFTDCKSNPGYIIGNNHALVHAEPGLAKAVDDGGPGAVYAQTPGTGVTYGDDGSVHICDSTFRGNPTEVGPRAGKQ